MIFNTYISVSLNHSYFKDCLLYSMTTQYFRIKKICAMWEGWEVRCEPNKMVLFYKVACDYVNNGDIYCSIYDFI